MRRGGFEAGSEGVEVGGDFLGGFLVAGGLSAFEAGFERRAGAVGLAALFQRPGQMEIGIAVGGINFERLLVECHGFIQLTLPGVFLSQGIEAEGVVRFGFEHFLQFRHAFVHAAVLSQCRSSRWYPDEMIMWHASGIRLLLGIALATAIATGGCNSSPRSDRGAAAPTEQSVRVTQHVGGTHYRVVKHEDVLYQTFGPELLVIESRSNRLVRTVELGAIGRSGSGVDMLLHDDRLYVVLDRDEVVELSVSEPETPRVLTRESAEALGILPQRLSIAEGRLYVSGIGGVVRWEDGRHVFRPDRDDTGEHGSIGGVATSGEGLVVCVGRRIYRLDDGRFVGSASDLMSAEGLDRAPENAMVFIRQLSSGAFVGLMTPNLREIDVERTTIVVRGVARSVRVFNNQIWVVTDEEILSFRLLRERTSDEAGLRLVNVEDIDVIGARDVTRTDDDHLAVIGSFGRSLYRLNTTSRGPGDTFIYAHREPSRLERAQTDSRHILAGGPEGAWLYRIGSRVQRAEQDLDEAPDPPTTADTVEAQAAIGNDGRVLTVETASRQYVYEEGGIGGEGGMMHTVVTVEGEFWIGHDDGITVLALPAEDRPRRARGQRGSSQRDQLQIVGRVRIDGPVRYLYPLRTERGVSFVSRYGGFGIARYAEEGMARSP